MHLAVLFLRCAVSFDAFIAQIQGLDRNTDSSILSDITGGFRDMYEAFALFAVDVDIVVSDGKNWMQLCPSRIVYSIKIPPLRTYSLRRNQISK